MYVPFHPHLLQSIWRLTLFFSLTVVAMLPVLVWFFLWEKKGRRTRWSYTNICAGKQQQSHSLNLCRYVYLNSPDVWIYLGRHTEYSICFVLLWFGLVLFVQEQAFAANASTISYKFIWVMLVKSNLTASIINYWHNTPLSSLTLFGKLFM